MPNEPRFMDDNAQMLWNASNFTTTVFLTSAVITLGHSPINTLMMLMAKGNTPLSLNMQLKFPTLVRTLYAGSLPYMVGTSSRTMVMTGAKKVEQGSIHQRDESVPPAHLSSIDHPSSSSLLKRFAAISAFSMGDFIVGQLPETLSLIQKAGIHVNWKTPHNLTKLYLTGGVSRYCFSAIYIGALCEAEQSIAPHMPFSNSTLNHIVAGTLSGAGAAYASYPFSRIRDDRVARLSAVNGKLIGPTLTEYVQPILHYIRSTSVKAILTDVIKDFVVQGNLRAVRAAYRFAAIVAVAELCGEEPLGCVASVIAPPSSSHSVGFFAQTPKRKAIEAQTPEALSDNINNKPK